MNERELADKIERAVNPPGGTWADYVRLDYDCWLMVIAALRASPDEADQRDAVLEEAAVLCETHDETVNTRTGERSVMKKTSDNINGNGYAAAIRALKRQSATEGKA